jgi:hypothetical protein
MLVECLPPFFVHCLQLCLVHKAGSLSVVEYGSNEVLAVCRTEHMSPYLLSVADTEARGTTAAAKRVAYLLDLQTIRVIDVLAGGQPLATISHDAKLDWLVRFTTAWLDLGLQSGAQASEYMSVCLHRPCHCAGEMHKGVACVSNNC